jgi:predicted homoserine dehydrogenase-like protein
LRIGGLPIGLAHHVKLRRAVKAGASLTWNDVVVDETSEAVRIRREMESQRSDDRDQMTVARPMQPVI